MADAPFVASAADLLRWAEALSGIARTGLGFTQSLYERERFEEGLRVAVKEVYEETGIECEPVSLIAVLDGLRLGFARVPLYSMVFHCKMLGGELAGHPLETRQVGFYPRDRLPQPLAGAHRWAELAFA